MSAPPQEALATYSLLIATQTAAVTLTLKKCSGGNVIGSGRESDMSYGTIELIERARIRAQGG